MDLNGVTVNKNRQKYKYLVLQVVKKSYLIHTISPQIGELFTVGTWSPASSAPLYRVDDDPIPCTQLEHQQTKQLALKASAITNIACGGTLVQRPGRT